MEIELEKIELLKLLNETEDPEVIKEIKCIFQLEKMGLIDKLSEEQVVFICQNVILDKNGNFLNLEDIIDSIEY
ncbi:MAG: hypothetical protein L6Q46_06565 [Flavobacterium sp.]|uniref:hypothetical protein n=1 Tax=Flavobacterium sp. TaxID=239 RepID=UPI0025C4D3D1|nr:hypothetical protein [Flavobacterium sp.]MCK6607956.1 hypothetical protein [Flavobacterium sp.]